MSETPQQPGTPEPHEVPPNPAGPRPAATGPTAPPAATTPPRATPGAQAAAAASAARRSTWNDTMSTTGGKTAVVVAAASIGLVVLLVTGLVAVGVARHFGGDRDRGMWTSNNDRGMRGPGQMNPGQGERGPGSREQLPPGLDRRGTGDLPSMEMGLGAGGALHGEAVVPGDGTATRTVVFQRGTVTAVTADKLTVKSTDGYSATYTIGAESRDRLANKVSTLATGDEVTVVAAKDGNETLRILKSGRSGAGSN